MTRDGGKWGRKPRTSIELKKKTGRTVDRVELGSLVGAWELLQVVSVETDGSLSYPLGELPTGLILYTPDGGMSATISAEADGDAVSVCYAGRVSIRGNTVKHHVLVGADPYGVGALLVRDAELATDGTLRLTARGPELLHVTWKRLPQW